MLPSTVISAAGQNAFQPQGFIPAPWLEIGHTAWTLGR